MKHGNWQTNLYRTNSDEIDRIKEQLDKIKVYLMEINPNAVI
jgi:hypothetical protein